MKIASISSATIATSAVWPCSTDLRAIRRRLAALHEDIPPSTQELSEEDLPTELDVATEIRSALEGAITAGLDPLIADLTTAAERLSASQG